MLNCGATKYRTMTQENHSSRPEEVNKEVEELKKKAENLQKILDMTRKTIDHDKKYFKMQTPDKHLFGEMM